MDTRRNQFLWILYDFANSIVSIVFFLYYSQWIVIDRGVSDFYFNITLTIAAILLLFTVPMTGMLLDASLRRISGIRLTTILTVIFYIICALAAVHNNGVLSIIFFTAGMYTYLLSFTFYSPLLHDIASPERMGRVSGLGIMANYLGQMIGLLVVLPFSTGAWHLFNAAPRAETLLPAVIIFFTLSLPMLIWFNEPKKNAPPVPFKTHIKRLTFETKTLFLFPSVGLFIASYFFFNDAVMTAANNFSIFLEQVWHFSDIHKTYIMIGILITSAIGGLVAGFIADKYGHKRTLVIILAGWLIILPVVGLLTIMPIFIIFTVLMGFWFGANWTVSRSVMTYIAPPGKHNLAFAYFGLAERASSFVGPVVWGLIVSNFLSIGEDRYRVATLAITLFIALGVFALVRIKDDKVVA